MSPRAAVAKPGPYTVALTGGIASGKTMVSDEFARLGAAVIDTDVIARQLVEPGQAALREVVQAFGPEVLGEDGRLRRAQLRSLIFSDPAARRRLESILHPRIRREVGEAIAKLRGGYCLVVIPLLNTRGAHPYVDRFLVVDVDPETQISRLMARDHTSRQQAEQALAAQGGRQQRLGLADDVLDNSGSPEQLRRAVAALDRKYRRLATAGAGG